MVNFVAYYRVSTQKQGQSGLGLDAQQHSVRQFVQSRGGELLSENIEIESGKLSSRPILLNAIAECRKKKAVLVIAKLDRLARNVAFVSSLMEGGIEFVAVDMPAANRLVIHILAAVAENERELISQRTKAALAAAKARGVKLGSYGQVLADRNRASATVWAETIREPILESLARGHITYDTHACYLNSKGLQSREGGRFHATSIARIMRRLSIAPDQIRTAAR